MKRNLLVGAFALAGFAAAAQTPFFDNVPYRGAFAPEPATPWTAGWTNFNPQNTNYPASTENVPAGDITSSTTWTKDKVYHISGYVYVTNNATLTIEPGTIIRGSQKGTIIICRGAKIIAQGTETEPIVFTSNQAVGDRDFGDWGGIVITGRAKHNRVEGVDAAAEGGIAKQLPSGDGRFGGNDDDDNSGVFSFVRIEFSGIPLSTETNSEINGLTLYSVGRQTKLDHIQVSYCGDDSFEWFGGTVDAKYLVAYKTWDDDFDTDNGFSGRIQFAVAFRDSRFADQSTSNGFETDNDANGTLRTPVTAPVFSNVTLIGPGWDGNTDSTNALFGRAIHQRRNSSLSVFNSIFTGYKEGHRIDQKRVVAHLCANEADIEENFYAGNTVRDFNLVSGSDTLCIADQAALAAWFVNTTQNNETFTRSNDVELVNPFGNTNTNPDFRPKTNSPAASGAKFTNAKLLPINTVSINEVVAEAVTFSVYPNPTSDVVNVTVNGDLGGKTTVTLTDLSGKTVSTAVVVNNVATIDVSNLTAGMYLVNVSNANLSHTSKVIVK